MKRLLFILFGAILMGAYYILFEMHNAWPYNEDKFATLRTICISSIIMSFIFMTVRRLSLFSVVPIILGLFVINALTRSESNSDVTKINLLILISLVGVSYALSKRPESRPGDIGDPVH